jgi:alkanesulfonate monooxygenase SsuD/methylene tetrahydromethanopterin reductase-like flavin-dependent oxidoreductase (luciferase family)
MTGNPFISLAAVATRTSRVQIGTSIALAFVRSPWVTALSALDLDALSGGRFVLGLGTGLKRLSERWHGWLTSQRPTKECIDVIRLIIERYAPRGEPFGTPVSTTTSISRLVRPLVLVRARIPIYLAGLREAWCSTAAEVQMVLGHPVCSPQLGRGKSWPALALGLQRSGRRRRDFHFCAAALCAIGLDAREARRAAAASIAHYATITAFEPIFLSHGFEAPLQAIHEAFLRGDTEAMIAAVSPEMVKRLPPRARLPCEVTSSEGGFAALSWPECFLLSEQVETVARRLSIAGH